MISQIISFAENLFRLYGAWGVFLASIIEEIIAPIPSSLVIMGAGFFLMDGMPINLSSFLYILLIVILPATFGVTIGSLFIYGLAYFAGKPFLKKYGKYVGISWSAIEAAEIKFSARRSGSLTIFILRVIPIIPSSIVSALAGLVRFPLIKYLIFTFLGTLIRATIFALIGFQSGSLYKTYAVKIDLAENFIIIGLFIILMAYILHRIFKKKI